MLNAVRRGPALARVLQACAPRALSSTKATPALVSNFNPAFSSTSYRSVFQLRSVQTTRSQNQANAAPQSVDTSDTITDFEELAAQGYVHPRIIQNVVQGMGIKAMTEVQSLTIPHTISGADTLAQAKTGTGKTLGFLIPVLQKIITNDPSLLQKAARLSSDSQDIRAIIISPTRELAEQIAVEAKKVAQGTGIVVQSAVGGTRKQEGLARIRREGCHILVATPGRLKDILSDPASRVSAPNLDIFVLDEADRLLDDGFGPEIESIKELLPDQSARDRQTLMFSATVPREVMGMVRRSMKPGFQIINTVSEDEVPTHLRVPQKVVFLRGFENGIPAAIEILNRYKERTQADPNLRPMKAIIYYNTTAETQLAYDTYSGMLNDPNDPKSRNLFGRSVYCMHSKLSQSQRTNFSDRFRRARSAILISSDVTARGLDFPDVTHVIQMGAPKTRESYIHRLGRTGRANKEGEGWVLIHDEEDNDFIQKFGGLPIEQDQSVELANANIAKADKMSEAASLIVKQTLGALKLVPYEDKADTYRIKMSSNLHTFRRKATFIAALNDLAIHGWGLPAPPSISSSTAAKLGLSNMPGLTISDQYRPSRMTRDRNGFGDYSPRFQRPQRDRRAISEEWTSYSEGDRFGLNRERRRRF